MSLFIQRYFRSLYLFLPVLLGISLGHLAANSLGVYVAPPVRPVDESITATIAPARKLTLSEYEVIVQRNLFDSTASAAISLAGVEETSPQPTAAAMAVRPNLTLFGTVVRGDQSLAVIRSGNEIRTFRLKDEVPGGHIEEIVRNMVRIKLTDGSMMDLPLHDKTAGSEAASAAPPPAAATDPRRRATAAAQPATPAATASGIRSVGENRWVIPREEADRARGNMNELLRQARMEPRITDGRTDGFHVRMIQPRSLLALLGIQRGDVLMHVNGVTLDSPEKALQIFQQLREARNISIGLLRNDEPLNFEYEID
jgi:general secretion pathway protein C